MRSNCTIIKRYPYEIFRGNGLKGPVIKHGILATLKLHFVQFRASLEGKEALPKWIERQNGAIKNDNCMAIDIASISVFFSPRTINNRSIKVSSSLAVKMAYL